MTLTTVLVAFTCLCVAESRSLNAEVSKARDLLSLIQSRAQKPNTIYYNGVIYTVNKDASEDWSWFPAEAMVVDADGVIEYVGTNVGAEDDQFWRHDTKWVNLRWKVILPGIHDVHVHPLEAGSSVGGVCTVPGNKQPTEMNLNELIAKCAPKQTGTSWVLGHGHSIHSMLDYIFERKGDYKTPRELLDDALSDKPIVIMEETSHSVWVNSRALELAGITDNSPIDQIPGGLIMKDEETGLPNGILLENAGNYILDLAFDPNANPDLLDIAYEDLLWSLYELNKNGITSVCDARTYWTRQHHKVWQDVHRDGELTVRTILGLWAYPAKTDEQLISNLRQLYSNDPESMLRVSQIKMYSDGIIGSTTAALLEAYRIDLGLDLPGNMGMNYFPENRMATLIGALQNIDEYGGFDFHIHTIGDRGVRETLNAIERNIDDQETPRRHRLTHVELVSEADLKRFADLDVVADAQVAGEFTLDLEEPTEFLGEERAQDFIPVKSLVQNGALMTLSSDWDVSELNPFIGMQHAMQRGHQSVTLKQAVEMYTINAAYVMRQEDKTGSLEVAKAADFVVIDQDIFYDVPVGDIHKTKVLRTFLQGKEVYNSKW